MKNLMIAVATLAMASTAFARIPYDIPYIPEQMPFKIMNDNLESATQQTTNDINNIATDITCPEGETLIGITYSETNVPTGVCTSGGIANRVFLQQQFDAASGSVFGRVDCPQGYKVIRHGVWGTFTSTVLNYHRLVDGDANLAGFVVGGGISIDPLVSPSINIAVTCEQI